MISSFFSMSEAPGAGKLMWRALQEREFG